jgi:hypothetical protein
MQRKERRMKNKFLVGAVAGAALMLSTLSFCHAEGTIAETWSTAYSPNKITLVWSSSTNGWVSVATTKYVRGKIDRVVYTSANAGPTDYVLALKDASSIDLLGGRGSCSSNTTGTILNGLPITGVGVTNVVPFSVNDILTLSVTNCGASKSGTVILYVE